MSMTQTMNHSGWTTFTDRHNLRTTIAIIGRHRYTITSSGYLMVTMARGMESIYEGKFRAVANARSYAEELADAGGPRR